MSDVFDVSLFLIRVLRDVPDELGQFMFQILNCRGIVSDPELSGDRFRS